MKTISGEARIAGVVGWPVSHSLSPRLHGYWLQRYGIDGAYVPLPVHPDSVPTAVAGLRALRFAGFNVTVPHKETMLGLVDEVDPIAQRIGAVNTVIRRTDGTLVGTNTDAVGFVENLRQSGVGFDFRGIQAAVVGAGGAARAVVAGLIEAGAGMVAVTNRTDDRTRQIQAALGSDCVRMVPWENRHEMLPMADLLVNTTTQGMGGHAPLDLSLEKLRRGCVVTDIVYAPLHTPLLTDALERGHRIVDGLGMLLYQAQAGFRAWFGVEPEVTDDLRRYVLAGLPR